MCIEDSHEFGRSDGFPLSGIFHPWAQWDRVQDPMGNSAAAAGVARQGGIEGFTKKMQYPKAS